MMSTLQTISALQTLGDALMAARRREQEANVERVKLEQEIIALAGMKAEGAQTHEAGRYKITITGKVTRSADMRMLEQLCDDVPANLRPIKVKREFDATGWKWLEQNEPAIAAKLAQAVTEKPAKPSVEIKLVDEMEAA